MRMMGAKLAYNRCRADSRKSYWFCVACKTERTPAISFGKQRFYLLKSQNKKYERTFVALGKLLSEKAVNVGK